MPPVSSLTSGDLTPAGKAALAQLAIRPFNRIGSAWRTTGTRVTLKTADQLKHRGLARVEIAGGRHQLVITGAGKMLAGVLEERKRS